MYLGIRLIKNNIKYKKKNTKKDYIFSCDFCYDIFYLRKRNLKKNNFCSNECRLSKLNNKKYEKKQKSTLICKIDGCNRDVFSGAKGYCNKHYTAFKKYGDPLVSKMKQISFCSVNGCSRKCSSHGYCELHFDRISKYGNPGSKEPMSHIRKYEINDCFFENESELSFYWAGFIAADGCILHRKDANSKVLSIELNQKDKAHLEKFSKQIYKSEYIIKDCVHYNNDKKSLSSIIRCQSFKIINDLLLKFNINNNKSLTYIPPNIENHSLIRHFIRGYFDGDGSVYYTKINENKYTISCSFIGTYEMCNFIIKVLHLNNINTKAKPYMVLKNKNCYSITLCGNIQVKKFYNWIYKDSNIYLDRKLERFQNFFDSSLQRCASHST